MPYGRFTFESPPPNVNDFGDLFLMMIIPIIYPALRNRDDAGGRRLLRVLPARLIFSSLSGQAGISEAGMHSPSHCYGL